MSLVELAQRIVSERDRCALRELHDHRVLCHRPEGDSLRLVEYIQVLSRGSLARRWCGHDDMAVTLAYDLTVDKFSHLPANAAGGRLREPEGPDCRYYYQAFINHVIAKWKANPPANSIETEMLATKSLRALVARHLHLSCLESRRRAQRLARRYLWKRDGWAMSLWLPLEMPGRRCRQWLEANIPDVDPRRPGEQERVQAIVNRRLGRPRFISADRVRKTADDFAVEMDPVASMIKEEVSTDGLVKTIADEKAEAIEQQRPAIRQLGAERVRQLVHEVFDGLVRGDYRADTVARHLGLSEASLSRFAGSRWRRDGAEPVTRSVPDLWRNTAQTLARHPDFVTAAKHAGVWKRVTDVLNTPDTGRRQPHG